MLSCKLLIYVFDHIFNKFVIISHWAEFIHQQANVVRNRHAKPLLDV